MIDGIKTNLAVLNIGTVGIYKFKGMFCTYRQDEFYTVRGSLHKYKNEGVHNADDFYLSDIKKVFDILKREIGLDSEITPLNYFEFGVNINIPFSTKRLLNSIILHKNSKGTTDKQGKCFDYERYALKIYTKSETENLIRVELRVKKRMYLKQKNVDLIRNGFTLERWADLYDFNLWVELERILIEAVNDCLIMDFSDTEINELTDENRIKYLNWCNPLFWERLHGNRMKYNREQDKCNKFVSAFSKSDIKTTLICLIQKKCNELRDIDTKTPPKNVTKSPLFEVRKNVRNVTKSPLINSECVTTSPKKDETENTIFCLGCGRLIPNPRKGQKFCSAKTVGYVSAHRCRNNDSNPRNDTKRAIKKIQSYPLMFPLSEIIAPHKKQYLEN